MRVTDLTIGKRLTLGFGLIVACFGVAMAIATLYLGRIQDAARQVAAESLPFALLAEEAAIEIIDVQQWLTDVSATHDPNGLQTAATAAERFHEHLGKFKAMYEPAKDAEHLRELEELTERFEQFYKEGRAMANAYVSEGMEAGNRLMTGFDKTAEQLHEEMGRFRNSQVAEARAKTAAIEAAVGSSRITLFICAGAVIMLSVIIGGGLTRSITRPLLAVVAVADKLARGNLSAKVTNQSRDETGLLAQAINQSTSQLAGMIEQIRTRSGQVAGSSEELSAVAHQLSGNSKQMTMQANSVASATEKMSFNINTMASAAEQISMNVATVSAGAEEMSRNMTSVASAVEEMSRSISGVADNAKEASTVAETAMGRSQSATRAMNTLGGAARDIGKVTEVIKRIAEQTNLLALNATIEAASAGEAGKGFVVVAHEIKELAAQSARAAEDIAVRINGVQKNTEESIKIIATVAEIINLIDNSVRDITRAVVEQSKVAGEIGASAAEADKAAANIAAGIAEIATGSNDVARNVGETARAANVVAGGIHEVRQASDDADASAGQVNIAARDLARVAGELRELVGRFQS